MAENTAPLVFVFIGDTLPDYVTPSLTLTRRFFRGNMVLLTNALETPSVDGVLVEDFSPWYQPEPFSLFAKKSPLDPAFRGGFWLAAAERFFVLSQYMSTTKTPKLFHAELDNIVFNLDGVADRLDETATGIFYPTTKDGVGLGSLVYCNQVDALNKLTDFMSKHTALGSEMQILGQFVKDKPTLAHHLPSETTLSSSNPAAVRDGVFDAASMGQWLWGIDPANTVYTTYSKAKHSHSPETLPGVTFSLNTRRGVLHGHTKTLGRFRIHNLHVHSKVFNRLVYPGVLQLYLLLNRLPWPAPVVTQPGHLRHHVLQVLLSRSRRGIVRTLLALPPGQACLRFLVATAGAPLSNRQLGILQKLLPRRGPARWHTSPSATVVIAPENTGMSSTLSCVVRRGVEFDRRKTGRGSHTLDEKKLFDTPRDALAYLLSLDADTVLVSTEEVVSLEGLGLMSTHRQVLWPDRKKPEWNPPFDLPIFPYRSRAVTFTTSPQLISLTTLRQLFDAPGVAATWAKQVRPDTFFASLTNVYGQHLLRNGPLPILVSRSL